MSSLLSLGRETSHYDFAKGKNFGTWYEMRFKVTAFFRDKLTQQDDVVARGECRDTTSRPLRLLLLAQRGRDVGEALTRGVCLPSQIAHHGRDRGGLGDYDACRAGRSVSTPGRCLRLLGPS